MNIVKLEPVDTGRQDKNGQQLYNLNLITKVDKSTGGVIQGLKVGESIVVEKVYDTGYESTRFPGSFSCKILYDGKLCSFWLKGEAYDSFTKAGVAGDQISITAKAVEYIYKGEKKTRMTFDCAKV